MIRFLVKKFIKNYENTKDKKVRESYTVLGGILGIVCNSFLFALKLIIGLIINSVSVISDSINNLSDSASSVVSLFSAKLSNKKPDKEHPFGHGRIEYIASLIVSFIIIFMGGQLLITSIEKTIDTSTVDVFNPILLIILSISILVKLWMYFYNKFLSKKIDSLVLKAAAVDCISDAITTSIIIISLIIGKYVSFSVDGIAGIIVSLLIIYNGIKLTLETSGTLLGKPASKEMVQDIEKILLKENDILGIHDLIIHDYGPGRKMASVHVEVSDKEDIIKIHELIDDLEKQIENELFIHMVIHMDPISKDNEETNMLSAFLKELLDKTNKEVSFHDLRITQGEKNVNVIFDLCIPFSFSKKEKEEFINFVKQEIKNIDNKYSVVINIDYHY